MLRPSTAALLLLDACASAAALLDVLRHPAEAVTIAHALGLQGYNKHSNSTAPVIQ
jgi:hypothetical protein